MNPWCVSSSGQRECQEGNKEQLLGSSSGKSCLSTSTNCRWTSYERTDSQWHSTKKWTSIQMPCRELGNSCSWSSKRLMLIRVTPCFNAARRQKATLQDGSKLSTGIEKSTKGNLNRRRLSSHFGTRNCQIPQLGGVLIFKDSLTISSINSMPKKSVSLLSDWKTKSG